MDPAQYGYHASVVMKAAQPTEMVKMVETVKMVEPMPTMTKEEYSCSERKRGLGPGERRIRVRVTVGIWISGIDVARWR